MIGIALAYTYTFRFGKTGEMIYISHLDLMRLLNRSARRADLPVNLTLGFNPHFKIKLQKALKLGVPSENEEGEFVLDKKLEVLEIAKRWQENLPKGIDIKEIQLRSES